MTDQALDDTPWEVSVLAAILNMRWAHHVRSPGYLPDLVNALDGAAETALGDILLREDDRLFLFELKASWERVRSEAKKPIFKLYESSHADAHANPNATLFDELLLLSVRCHHLVYWEDEVALDDGAVRGSISFSPYALFVLDEVIVPDSLPMDFRYSHALAVSRHGETSIIEAASIADLFDQSASAASGNLKDGSDVRFSELGLCQDDFMRFVKLLHGEEKAGDISLKLIAFSPVSGFVRRIGSLEDAIQLGLDWAAGTATAKPVTEAGKHRAGRTGRTREVDKQALACAPNIQSAGINKPTRRGLRGGGGKMQ